MGRAAFFFSSSLAPLSNLSSKSCCLWRHLAKYIATREVLSCPLNTINKKLLMYPSSSTPKPSLLNVIKFLVSALSVEYSSTFSLLGRWIHLLRLKDNDEIYFYNHFHENTSKPIWYSNYNSNRLLLIPSRPYYVTAWRSHIHADIKFKSLPPSLDFIVTIWEQKKEKKKQAMVIFAMLGVVCYDKNDSAELHIKKDIERNTEHVLHRGELSILVQHFVRWTKVLTTNFIPSSITPPPVTCQLSCNLLCHFSAGWDSPSELEFPQSVAC